MAFGAMLLAAAVAASTSIKDGDSGVQSMLNEESPDVFLAKATLQQYLSRVVRRDWDGARRLTHPKTLAVLRDMKKRIGSERHSMAPWANSEVQLKTFEFRNARVVGPGMVAVEVAEDTYRTEEQGMSVGDPAVYLLFKSRGGFLVADKKSDTQLADVSDQSVRIGYPGYVDPQLRAQARR
jgi:hypothetical protein